MNLNEQHQGFKQTVISQQYSFGFMQPSKRPSLPSPTSLPPSHHPSQRLIEPALDCQRIQKYIEFMRNVIRNRLKEKNFTFEENDLKEFHRYIKSIQNYHLKSQKEHQSMLAELKEHLQKTTACFQEEISVLKIRQEQTLQEKQREWNQKLLALNNDTGRKEQNYKETIQKFMNALALAQKNQQQLQLKLATQMQSVAKALKAFMATQRRDHYLANAIHDMVEEIALRQENSLISSKSGEEPSFQEIDLPISKPSDHEERDSGVILDPNEGCLQKQLQGWLVRLICFGLFEKENQQCLKKMISFTRGYEQATELLEDKIFPVMMEMLTSNMLKNQEKGWRYLQGSSGIRECWQGSRIQLRNINNLSQLQINNGWEVSMGESETQQGKKAKFF